MSGVDVFSFESPAIELLLDISFKVTFLAFIVWGATTAVRVRSVTIRHRMWLQLLLGMILMPALVLVVPAVALPGWMFPVSASTESPRTGPIAESLTQRTIRYPQEATPFTDQALTPVAPLPPESPIAEKYETESAFSDAPTPIALPKLVLSNDRRPVGEPSQSYGIKTASVILVIYALGTVILLTRLLFGLFQCSRLMRRSRPVDLTSNLTLSQVGATIAESSDILVPVTVGLIQSRIVLPADWRTWDESLIEAAVLHEAEHVRRRDTWVILLANLNTALYLFHPLSWIVRRQLTDLAEQVCDDAVVRSTGQRNGYAELLVKMARRLASGSQRYQPSGIAMARKPLVEKRVCRIVDSQEPLSRRVGTVGSVTLACISTAIVIVTAGLSSASRETLAADVTAVRKGNPENDKANTSALVTGKRINEDASNAKANATSSPAAAAVENQNGEILVKGRVRDDSGVPVHGAHLWLPLAASGEDVVEATTDDEGAYVLRVPEAWTRPRSVMAG